MLNLLVVECLLRAASGGLYYAQGRCGATHAVTEDRDSSGVRDAEDCSGNHEGGRVSDATTDCTIAGTMKSLHSYEKERQR